MRIKDCLLFWIVCSFYCSDLTASTIKPLFISLGQNCWIATAIKKAGLRREAYPFDWIFSMDDEGLNKAIQEDFKYFTDKSVFIRGDYHPSSVYNQRYGLQFIHDYPYHNQIVTQSRYDGHLAVIHKKYTRRINRFRSLQKHNGKVFFFRLLYNSGKTNLNPNWRREQAIKLRESLNGYFPNLDFMLIILTPGSASVPGVGEIDGVLEFKIPSLTTSENYLDMFNELSLSATHGS